MIERFEVPSSRREARRLDAVSRYALNELAGRTVWSASAASAGRESAERLTGCLRWALDDGVVAASIELDAGEQETSLAPVAREDLVVLHDSRAAALAQPARERGAHVVSRVGAGAAFEPSRPPVPAVDAYLMAWADWVAAMMPASALISLKEVGRLFVDLGWGSALADIVHGDRAECVGGTLHPRPTVAAR